MEPALDDEGEQDPDDGEDGEDAAPVGDAEHLAADDGGDDRGDARDQHQGGEEAGHVQAVVEVADDGSGDDDARRPGQALEQPEADEQLGGGGEGADGGGQYVDHHAGEQRSAASPAVAQRPDDQLAEGHARQARGQGELDGGGGAVQGAGDGGQGREVHVHGERGQRGEPAQDKGDEEARTPGGCGYGESYRSYRL